jgi:hypothetical protein
MTENRGWTPSFTDFIAGSLGEAREKIEQGWTPSPGFSWKWVRLLMDQVDQPRDSEDPVHDAVSEAAVAVENLALEVTKSD